MSAMAAEFANAGALRRAATAVTDAGFRIDDALTPFPMPDVEPQMESRPPLRLRGPMAVAGFGAAALLYGLEAWSAGWAYPFDAGGRPLQSWPVFGLVPFEVGILAAGLAALVCMLVGTGLPRLHHEVFEFPGTDRASQDRFILICPEPAIAREAAALRALLVEAGALSFGVLAAGAAPSSEAALYGPDATSLGAPRT